MVASKVGVCITLPIKLLNQIDKKRESIPRSTFITGILIKGMKE